ncbi:DegT/DnrJ/EryC1/StrS family aminotransferase [Bradyrhizobium sp. WSM471]|uniref:DegT/DnrJ/EryC1/StrS family aminotransferase n=1 Tax=Bradyrhizobium sp. WSM471 TaxID=319017 RepID=UPI00024D2C2A|nr:MULTISPECIES: DegT/DnrJ/EryC1/StrS family aminotransferase [Bradyrhizobium]EHR04629.1 putative PLP-dependent enzyme possibly involved in cell wall biogenesis [Bradyrhizobium sp. WSM471]UFW39777.1 DegT/DnrJ/EryC1/StrS family aminotransferase [Bradyrhizobium canariense]
MQVPFFDWSRLYTERSDKFREIMHETCMRGGFILQKDVVKFEENLRTFLGVKHAVALSDATNAILLGLRASGIRPGDEVILPSHGFVAAAQSIHHAGGVPILVEIGEDWMVDPAAMEKAITERTRFLMPVQVNGRTCDMDQIQAIAHRHNLIVIEDSAQALGAKYKGRPTGTIGQWGCYSFYPSKTLGCFGDGGALVTNDDEIARRVKLMRNHGANEDKVIEPDIAVWGTNSRLDNIHAAILNYKLGYYAETLDRRREIAKRYHDAFADLEEISRPPGPDSDSDRVDVFQNYELEADRRDELRSHLRATGIGTIVQWGGLGMHQMRGLGFSQELKRTDRFFERSLLLPMNHMLTDAEVNYIIDQVRQFYR